MIVIDANLLLYAYESGGPKHARVAGWLNELLAGDETVGLPWVTIWAFLRVSTNPRIWNHPLDAKTAFDIVLQWLAQPGVVALQPGPRHAEILRRLVEENDAPGPLVTDAALAALAIENGALLASTDQDFRRFPELRWINPLEGSQS